MGFKPDKITTGDTNKIVRDIKKPKTRPQPLEGKYEVIYADPPWQYSNSGFDESAESHYPTMSLDELKELRISSLAAEPCVLFLWVTSPLLPDGLEVMDAWGFEYKTNRVWIKPSAPSMGWWLRTKHELLLVGTANGLAHPRDMVDSVIQAPVTEHSRKPEQVYVDIERCYLGSKIELFARNERPGWNAWGNEVE